MKCFIDSEEPVLGCNMEKQVVGSKGFFYRLEVIIFTALIPHQK